MASHGRVHSVVPRGSQSTMGGYRYLFHSQRHTVKGIISLIPTPLMDWEVFEPAAIQIFASLDSDVGKKPLLTANAIGFSIPQIALQAVASVRTAVVSGSFLPLDVERVVGTVRSVWQDMGDVQVDQEAMVLRSSDKVYLLLGPVTTTEYPTTTDLFAEGFTIVARPGSGPPLVEEMCSQKRYLAFPIVDSSKVSSKL